MSEFERVTKRRRHSLNLDVFLNRCKSDVTFSWYFLVICHGLPCFMITLPVYLSSQLCKTGLNKTDIFSPDYSKNRCESVTTSFICRQKVFLVKKKKRKKNNHEIVNI